MNRDMLMYTDAGGYVQPSSPKRLLIRHFNLAPIVGLGYWSDVYDGKLGFKGVTHNLIIPFIRIQWGYLEPFV